MEININDKEIKELIKDDEKIFNSLCNPTVDKHMEDFYEKHGKYTTSNTKDSKSYSELYCENIKLVKEVEQLKEIINNLDQYKKYYNACFAGLENSESDTAYYDNIKELFDAYAFEESSKLSNDAKELKDQLLFLVLYFVYKLRNDDFYGIIIRHILSNSSDYFTNNLDDYKKLPYLIKSIINLGNRKILKNILEESYNEKYD